MESFRQALIDDFGLGYVKFGHSELMGRIVGLLLCATEPLDSERIADELHVSKSPVNHIARRLEELNLIRRVRFKGDRKYYYEISPHVFLQAGANLNRLEEQNLHTANTHLRSALERFETTDGEEREAWRVICGRLIQMREFHLRMIDAFRQFMEQWQVDRNDLPGPEEYGELLDVPNPVPTI